MHVSEVLFINGGFVVDIPDQGTVQKSFRLRPEFVAGFAVAFDNGNQRYACFARTLLKWPPFKSIQMPGLFRAFPYPAGDRYIAPADCKQEQQQEQYPPDTTHIRQFV